MAGSMGSSKQTLPSTQNFLKAMRYAPPYLRSSSMAAQLTKSKIPPPKALWASLSKKSAKPTATAPAKNAAMMSRLGSGRRASSLSQNQSHTKAGIIPPKIANRRVNGSREEGIEFNN